MTAIPRDSRADAAPGGLKSWLVLSAGASCAGWLLSAAGSLNGASYAVLGVAFVAWIGLRARRAGVRWSFCWQKVRQRFRRPLPFAFLLLAGLALIGGALYSPTNYDALAYRLPRVLHWLAEGRWHWIHTEFPRLNVRACGSEWLLAPLLALTRSDRLLFLPNIVSFLLLPGLIFSVFTRFGVARRVAWAWMWLLPSGYCFALQAGSIANDLTAAPYALAAVDFALRARASRRVEDLWWSILAAALLTGMKASNILLLLAWACVVLPQLPLLLSRPLATAGWVAFAALSSFLPTAAMNFHYSGDWTGLRSEGGISGQTMRRTSANWTIFLMQNFLPPIIPSPGVWNDVVAPRLPAPSAEAVNSPFRLREMTSEEDAGLGVGICLLAVVSVAISGRRREPSSDRKLLHRIAVWGAWVSVLVFAVRAPVVGSAARLITPYYPLLVVPWLRGFGQQHLVRRHWWRVSATLVFASSVFLMVVTPARPLFPALTLLGRADDTGSASRLATRARAVYATYRDRADGFAPVLAQLPPGVKQLGFVTFDDPETSLWKPLGSRKIEHVVGGETPASIRQRGLEYVLIQGRVFEAQFGQTVAAWVSSGNAHIVWTLHLPLRASEPPMEWTLVRID